MIVQSLPSREIEMYNRKDAHVPASSSDALSLLNHFAGTYPYLRVPINVVNGREGGRDKSAPYAIQPLYSQPFVYSLNDGI